MVVKWGHDCDGIHVLIRIFCRLSEGRDSPVTTVILVRVSHFCQDVGGRGTRVLL